MKKRALCWLLALVMVVSLLPTFELPSRAVSGDEIAVDGSNYSGTSTSYVTGAEYLYKTGSVFKTTHSATYKGQAKVTVTVSNGLITNVTANGTNYARGAGEQQRRLQCVF